MIALAPVADKRCFLMAGPALALASAAEALHKGPMLSHSDLRHAEAWVFDLDNTLYPASCNLFDRIDERMKAWIADFLNVDHEEAFRVQKLYFREYGTTLRGLMERHGVDPEPYLAYVHDIDVSAVTPNLRLQRALAALPGRKLVFTNGSVRHAHRVMDRLGVTHLFEAVFDIAAGDYVPKPDPAIYRLMLSEHEVEPAGAVMVEDMARNLEPAAALGMTTVWVDAGTPWSREGSDAPYVHYRAADLTEWLEGLAQ
jgi:putative hydrolase of the HAD superfamily